MADAGVVDPVVRQLDELRIGLGASGEETAVAKLPIEAQQHIQRELPLGEALSAMGLVKTMATRPKEAVDEFSKERHVLPWDAKAPYTPVGVEALEEHLPILGHFPEVVIRTVMGVDGMFAFGADVNRADDACMELLKECKHHKTSQSRVRIALSWSQLAPKALGFVRNMLKLRRSCRALLISDPNAMVCNGEEEKRVLAEVAEVVFGDVVRFHADVSNAAIGQRMGIIGPDDVTEFGRMMPFMPRWRDFVQGHGVATLLCLTGSVPTMEAATIVVIRCRDLKIRLGSTTQRISLIDSEDIEVVCKESHEPAVLVTGGNFKLNGRPQERDVDEFAPVGILRKLEATIFSP